MSIDKAQRLQKVLAARGAGSRRQIEDWIAAGLVRVNGVTAVLGTKVTEQDDITINNQVVRTVATEQRVILYNKPVGQICTRNDPQGRETVFTSLPALADGRWISIGRLDVNSSGLILFTTDGELANKLMHPKTNIVREYKVRVLGVVTPRILRNITTGVTLDDGTRAKFVHAKPLQSSGANTWYQVALTQGRYREVRRIWESQGLKVSRLLRVSYGPLQLPKNLLPGDYAELDYAHVLKLFKLN